jgi:hypothetical protein
LQWGWSLLPYAAHEAPSKPPLSSLQQFSIMNEEEEEEKKEKKEKERREE